MKMLLKTTAVVAAMILSSASAFAQSEGGHDGNGGDANEMIFKTIAANIGAWIRAGNAESLQLPNGVNLTRYKSGMLDAIEKYRISFQSAPVVVDGEEKTCRNRVDEKQVPRIVCNTARFASVKSQTEEQYRLVHHELAGLAGIEVNTSRGSDYAISNQISAYLRSESVLRLPVVLIEKVKPTLYTPVAPFIAHHTATSGGYYEHEVMNGSCRAIDKKALVESKFKGFARAIAQILTDSGRKIRSIKAKFGSIETKLVVSKGLPKEPDELNVFAKAALIVQLENGVELTVEPRHTPSVSKYGESLTMFGTMFMETTKTSFDRDGEMTSQTTSCLVFPLNNGVIVKNTKTQQVIMDFGENELLVP